MQPTLPAFLFLTLIFCCGCEKEPFSSAVNVPLATIALGEVTDNTVEVTGKLVTTNNRTINAISLNWFRGDFPQTRVAPRYLLPTAFQEGETFSARVDRDLLPETTYAFRWVLELDNDERIYTETVSAQVAAGAPQPFAQQFTLSTQLAESAEGLVISSELFQFRRDNQYVTRRNGNFEIEIDLPVVDFPTSSLFISGSEVAYWIEVPESTLYLKDVSTNRVELWINNNEESSVTNLGVMQRPVYAYQSNGDIYFFGTDQRLYHISSLAPFSIERIEDVPYSTRNLLSAHATASEDWLYYLLRKNDVPNRPTSLSELELYAFNTTTQSWITLEAPPQHASWGDLWLSAEPGKLIFGGGNTGSGVVQNPDIFDSTTREIWWQDVNEDESWQFIGWQPFAKRSSGLQPIYSERKHHFFGVDGSGDRETTYYTFDFGLLQDF